MLIQFRTSNHQMNGCKQLPTVASIKVTIPSARVHGLPDINLSEALGPQARKYIYQAKHKCIWYN